MPKNLLTNAAGLSLIETMLALLVFSIGILAVAAMQDVTVRSNAMARFVSRNSLAATSILEQFYALPFDDGRLADTDQCYDLENPDHGPFPLEGLPSTLEWEIHDDFPAPDLKRITVTVHWQGAAGRPVRTRYDMIRARDDY